MLFSVIIINSSIYRFNDDDLASYPAPTRPLTHIQHIEFYLNVFQLLLLCAGKMILVIIFYLTFFSRVNLNFFINLRVYHCNILNCYEGLCVNLRAIIDRGSDSIFLFVKFFSHLQHNAFHSLIGWLMIKKRVIRIAIGTSVT